VKEDGLGIVHGRRVDSAAQAAKVSDWPYMKTSSKSGNILDTFSVYFLVPCSFIAMFILKHTFYVWYKKIKFSLCLII
jgi:hypothetical protein